MADEDRKPSKAIEAVVYEFGIRWPCPRDVDPDRYNARMRDLMRLCASMAPGLLRKAGDRVAVQPDRPFTLPSAAELHEAADAIIADRAAMQAAVARADAQPSRPVAPGISTAAAETARRYNRENDMAGSPFRWTDKMDMFQIGGHGERRATRDDGTVIEPWFGEDKEWHPPQGDSGILESAYREHRAAFTVAGGKIIAAGMA